MFSGFQNVSALQRDPAAACLGDGGQMETHVCGAGVMERSPDRPLQFNSKAGQATLQTRSA